VIIWWVCIWFLREFFFLWETGGEGSHHRKISLQGELRKNARKALFMKVKILKYKWIFFRHEEQISFKEFQKTIGFGNEVNCHLHVLQKDCRLIQTTREFGFWKIRKNFQEVKFYDDLFFLHSFKIFLKKLSFFLREKKSFLCNSKRLSHFLSLHFFHEFNRLLRGKRKRFEIKLLFELFY